MIYFYLLQNIMPKFLLAIKPLTNVVENWR